MEKIVADIKSTSPEATQLRITIHKVDVGISDEIANMFKEIQEQHQTHVDILVSNAGYGKRIVDVWCVRAAEQLVLDVVNLMQGHSIGGVRIYLKCEPESVVHTCKGSRRRNEGTKVGPNYIYVVHRSVRRGHQWLP